MSADSSQPISGLDLAEAFYLEAVKPILDKSFPDLHYSAALIGPGSEVLGFDDGMSTDHDWGPRVLIFLRKNDFHQKKNIERSFSNKLPQSFLGDRSLC